MSHLDLFPSNKESKMLRLELVKSTPMRSSKYISETVAYKLKNSDIFFSYDLTNYIPIQSFGLIETLSPHTSRVRDIEMFSYSDKLKYNWMILTTSYFGNDGLGMQISVNKNKHGSRSKRLIGYLGEFIPPDRIFYENYPPEKEVSLSDYNYEEGELVSGACFHFENEEEYKSNSLVSLLLPLGYQILPNNQKKFLACPNLIGMYPLLLISFVKDNKFFIDGILDKFNKKYKTKIKEGDVELLHKFHILSDEFLQSILFTEATCTEDTRGILSLL